MPGQITIPVINSMLTGLTAYNYLSLHTAYSAVGGNELVGGTYARQLATYVTPTTGVMFLDLETSALPVVFPTPPASTVSWIGAWDSAVAGNFLGMGPNQGSIPMPFYMNDTSGGQFTAYQHGLPTLGGQAVVWSGTTANLPLGLVVGTEYWVTVDSTDTFHLALTESGDAIVPSTQGRGWIQRIQPIALSGSQDFTVYGFTIDARDL